MSVLRTQIRLAKQQMQAARKIRQQAYRKIKSDYSYEVLQGVNLLEVASALEDEAKEYLREVHRKSSKNQTMTQPS